MMTKEEKKEYHKRYYQNNSEKQKADRKEWYQKNKEYALDWVRTYRKDNPEKVKASLKKYKDANSDTLRRKGREYSSRIRSTIFDILGNSCTRCGFSDVRALQIDHINGGGNIELRSIAGHKYKFILEKILNGSTEYQTLCANCNWIKRIENNEVPLKPPLSDIV